jgi:hypothetical protein
MNQMILEVKPAIEIFLQMAQEDLTAQNNQKDPTRNNLPYKSIR